MLSKAMTRSEFFQAMADASETAGLNVELTKKQAQSVFDVIGTVIVANLAKRGRIPLGALGTVVLVDRKARMGRNPMTGEAIKIKAKRAVKLRPARLLKDAFNKAK